jgi:hypothetical protein
MLKMTGFFRKHFNAAGRIDPRVGLLLLLISAVVIAGTALDTRSSRSPSQASLAATPQPTSISATTSPDDAAAQLSATPLPPEYITNQQQTIGLTLAAAALVLVVVIGVLAAYIQNPGDI